MLNIKVLGSGCKNCETTARLIETFARENGIEIQLEKITDMADIMSYGVMSTPGIVVNDNLVHAGGLPTPEQIRGWLDQ